MARYINADKITERIKVSPAFRNINDGLLLQRVVIDLLNNMPTADVAPKSEVENLKVLLEMKEIAYEGLRELYHTDTDALVEARRKTEVEVAREIFEEIEKIIDKHHSECYEYEDGDECDTAITYISYISCDLDELKKKYTGEQT